MQPLAYAVLWMDKVVLAVGLDVSENGGENFGNCGVSALENFLFVSPYQMKT